MSNNYAKDYEVGRYSTKLQLIRTLDPRSDRHEKIFSLQTKKRRGAAGAIT
jgi:hypothetical protein